MSIDFAPHPGEDPDRHDGDPSWSAIKREREKKRRAELTRYANMLAIATKGITGEALDMGVMTYEDETMWAELDRLADPRTNG